MKHILVLGAILMVSASSAEAIDCAAELPTVRKGHWTYRIVDGRKCWYAGRASIPKSSLRWVKRERDPSPVNAKAEMSSIDRADFTDPEDGSCCWPPATKDESFETRWRALLK